MKTLGIVAAGLIWAGIALAVTRCFGAFSDIFQEMAFKYAVTGIATSAIITRIYSRRIFQADVRRDKTLPLATLATAIPIWSLSLFLFSALIALLRGSQRGHPFDGFWFFTLYALGISFTLLLPLTYCAAYFTQRFIARCGGIKNS